MTDYTKKILLFFFLSVFLNLFTYAASSDYLKAYGAFFNEDYLSAVDGFTKILEEESASDTNIILSRGVCYFYLGQYAEAKNDLQKTINLNNPDTYLFLAKIYQVTDADKDAFICLNKAITLDPIHVPERIFKDSMLLEFSSSEEWFNLMQSNNSPEKEVLNQVSYLLKREKSKEAIEFLNQHLGLANNKAVLYSELGRIYELRKEYALGTQMLRKSLELESANISFQLQYAYLLGLNNETEKAYQQYTRIIEQRPEVFEAYFQRAILGVELKQYQTAGDDINVYLNYYKKTAEAEFLLAKINSLTGESLEALKQINLLLEADQSRADYFVLRGDLYSKMGTYKYAAYDYSMALDLNPYEGYTYLQYGFALLKTGNQKKACYAWNKAVSYKQLKAIEYLNKYCQ